MQRRTFIQSSLGTLAAMPFLGISAFSKTIESKPAWLINWIKILDEQMTNFEKSRVTDRTNKHFGAFMDTAEIPNPHSTAGYIGRACMLMYCPESIYYQSKEILKTVEETAEALLKFQYPDGTVDLLSTNFHSTPDTAFVLENIIPAYKFLKETNITGSEKTLAFLERFIKNAAEALIVGGIHTPNHRWVVSAALVKINEVFPDKRLVNRAKQWLAEHIDIDPDGQYTEKSTHVYSPIVNRALIDIAEGLKKPELLEYVRKNLLMTLYYIHPNGEVVTEASSRQDRGVIGKMSVYYGNYRYMAVMDNNGQMAAACRLIEKTNSPQALSGYLAYFLENPQLWRELPANQTLPTNYLKAFPYSGIVRIRRENWDCTILSKNTSWITFHKGNAVLQGMRVACSFFGKGQFDSEKIEYIGDNWILNKTLEGPYYQPFEKDQISPDGDFEKMPRNLRKQSEIQKLETTVKIVEKRQGIEVEIEMKGTENVPVSLELIFRPGGTFKGVEKISNSYLLYSQQGEYVVGEDKITFGPGKVEHKGVQLRGALPAMDAPTVYITGFTPFNHVINIY
jgi:hypothetical protein